MTNNLDGKVALVTGGTTGIGRETAIAFARAGAKVVVSGRGSERGQETVNLIQKEGGEATFVQTDISQATEVEALITQTVEIYGSLDCALNNAGVEGKLAPITELSEEDLNQVVDINLKGTWFCLKYEIMQMLKQGKGAIVNTSSGYGEVGGANLSPYCASKHGIMGLTKSLALEYAKQGIRINTIAPGPIDTGMPDRGTSSKEVLDNYISTFVPMGRMGTAPEVAEAVIWLCSDAASFVTGTSIAVDGGYLAQ
ncbi:putative NAD(P)-binding oxidoreductase with NAD(P)-binding Rossmann-fold domain [Hyella patelloides LEGE 07179]|uniref:Putative NAD(P)-binding oxidoreductase with NAD(P)-binding Rossmann-fold domain n=1 Tax=Hyella patelloides LEGE 07179 TaxID=945734 RepID=A0A563W1L5_9CYAN|nr:SDR family oxidoreductase [Hyella patelloides]VEP17592.1 putative NAD(P)-binding oxidoreductase with NAD(P)-binding Rossmann-fold domain [Hyella patelloides LEGE 07179]